MQLIYNNLLYIYNRVGFELIKNENTIMATQIFKKVPELVRYSCTIHHNHPVRIGYPRIPKIVGVLCHPYFVWPDQARAAKLTKVNMSRSMPYPNLKYCHGFEMAWLGTFSIFASSYWVNVILFSFSIGTINLARSHIFFTLPSSKYHLKKPLQVIATKGLPILLASFITNGALKAILA